MVRMTLQSFTKWYDILFQINVFIELFTIPRPIGFVDFQETWLSRWWGLLIGIGVSAIRTTLFLQWQ